MAREIPYGERLAMGFRMIAANQDDPADDEAAEARALEEVDRANVGHWDYRRGWVKTKLPDD